MRKLLLITVTAAFMFVGAPWFLGAANAQQSAKEEPKAKAPAETQAKEAKPVSIYRVDYAVHELEDGRRTNTRNYTLMVEADNKARLRVGTDIPLGLGEKGLQLQYRHVGLNIDCGLRERDGYLVVRTTLNTSSVAMAETKGSSSSPVIRDLGLEDDTKAVLGKPALVGAIDDVTANRRYELEVTVTKAK